MGIFPYTCEICGGGYNRCGNQISCSPDCNGSQMCYEDTVVIKLSNGEIIFGIYDGYGQITSDTKDNVIYIPTEFEEFIPHWNISKKTKVQLVSTVYCKSCYESMNDVYKYVVGD